MKEFVTTNWDRYLEDYTGAKPFVYETDMPFWGFSERSVLKVHGTIDNFDSIVATRSDYTRCEQSLSTGLIGAKLKSMLAQQTCIFVGYSLSDDDFVALFNLVKDASGKFHRTHYLVLPFIDDEQRDFLSSLGIVPIQTDGTFFLKSIKDHMCGAHCYAADETYDILEDTLFDVIDEHSEFVESFSPFESPSLLSAVAYQDGVIHALQQLLDSRTIGRYSDLHNLQRAVHAYDDRVKRYQEKGNYWDSSYFAGYLSGLLYFLFVNLDDRGSFGDEDPETPEDDTEGAADFPLPIYYHHGYGEVFSREEYRNEVREKIALYPQTEEFFRKFVDDLEEAEEIVFQHTPFG